MGFQDFLHPEGLPNIGPQSDSCWLEGDNAYPAKTDLLHTGHLKGGKLIIVSSTLFEIAWVEIVNKENWAELYAVISIGYGWSAS